MLGRSLSHYKIIDRLGGGGMGTVYRAHDAKLGRQVALKFLHPHEAASPAARLRFEQEARAASALNHPSICTIYAVEEVDGEVFISMEYVEGETLAEVLSRGPLNVATLLNYGLAIADALEAAHAAGIVHRDLKPSNVMINARGVVKVLDFGLAKVMSAPADQTLDTRLTDAGTVLGTAAYMSPEQTRGEDLDARSDIFSLGSLLYEAACGRPAFVGGSSLRVMDAVANDRPPAATTVRPDLPNAFHTLLDRMMEKDRAKRLNNAGEIVTAFRAMMTTGEVGALTPDQQDTQTVIAIVGRESELNHLQRLLTQTIASSGKIVFVTGEAGIGKTSIADTFLRIVRERFSSVVISRGHCIEQYGTGEAYLPFLEALGNLLTSPRRDRVAGILRTHAPTWCLQLPSVFGSSGVIEQLQRETIGASKERMQRELTDALLQFTTIAPMLLLLEDLHWADASTIDLLRHICHRISGHRLMVIGTFRAAEVESSTDHPLKGYRAEMRSRNLCEEIALSTLSRESLRVYLEERFAPNDFPGDLIALVHHKTEGHPLFATALLQYLEEGGILVWHEDRWTLSRAIEQVKLEVPETVLSMIQRQLQGLSEDDRKLLQYASVEGEEFHSTALAALIQRSDVEVEEDLARILKKHRVIGAPDEIEFPDGEIATRYRFAHALYQNVLYSEVVSKRRVALHREVASYLLARHRGEANRIAAQLARHHENGRDFVRAVECLDVAADNAISVFANAEANAHLSKAIELLSKTSEEERSSVEAALLRKRGTVRVAVSDFNGAVADFTAALESSRKANKPKAECMALIALSNALFWSHRMEEMAARVAEAEDAARRADDEGLKIEITMMIAMKHLCYGELRDAKSRLDEVIRRSSESSYTPGLNSGLAWRGALHFFQSEYASAEELLLRAHALSTQLRDSFTIMDSLFFLGLSRGNMGRMSEALTTLQSALDTASRNGDRFWFPRLPNCIGWIYRELGDLSSALKHDQAGVEIARVHKVLEAEANSLINIGIDKSSLKVNHGSVEDHFRTVEEIFHRDAWFRWRYKMRHLAAQAEHAITEGRFNDARALTMKLSDHARQNDCGKYMAVSKYLEGLIAIHCEQWEEARSAIEAALETLKTRPVVVLEWKVYAALAQVHRKQGSETAAQVAGRQARRIVQEIAASVTDADLREKFLASASQFIQSDDNLISTL